MYLLYLLSVLVKIYLFNNNIIHKVIHKNSNLKVFYNKKISFIYMIKKFY